MHEHNAAAKSLRSCCSTARICRQANAPGSAQPPVLGQPWPRPACTALRSPRAALLWRSLRKSLTWETVGKKDPFEHWKWSIFNFFPLKVIMNPFFFFLFFLIPFTFVVHWSDEGLFWSGTETVGCLLIALMKNLRKVGMVSRSCRLATRARTVLVSYWSNAGFVCCPLFLAVVFARGGFIFMSRGWLDGNGWAVGCYGRPSCCMCVWLCSVLLIDGGD